MPLTDVDLGAQCGCGCRPESATEPGCPCKECQPGPGIDHEGNQGFKERHRRERLRYLLAKDTDLLTDSEVEELDGLLHWTIHRM